MKKITSIVLLFLIVNFAVAQQSRNFVNHGPQLSAAMI